MVKGLFLESILITISDNGIVRLNLIDDFLLGDGIR